MVREGMKMLREDNIEPNSYVYNGYMMALSAKGKTEEMERFFRQHKRDFHDLNRPYNIMLHHFIDAKRPNKVHDLLEEMEQERVMMPATTYNILLKDALDSGKEQRFWELIDSMKKHKISSDNITYYLQLLQHQKAGNHAACIALFQYVQKTDGDFPIQGYNAILQSFVAMERDTEVIEVLDYMTQKKMKPDNATHSILIAAFGRLGNLKALQYMASIIMESKAKSRVKVNSWVYTRLLDQLHKLNDYDTCALLLEDMRAKGVAPSMYLIRLELRK